jgi:predicted AAA+ superfamily ATPase
MPKGTPDDIEGRYRQRVIDKEVSELLEIFGGLHITGPKWCGKSWTGMHHSKSVLFVGDEDSATLAKQDPAIALEGEWPRLVDEWQDVPKLWDVARRMIDLESKRGMFIFTGSVTPPKGATHHSGIGRFAKIRMYPMSLFESGNSSGVVSLSAMFAGEKLENTKSFLDYSKTVRLICKGGWPVNLDMEDHAAMKVPNKYIEILKDSDFSDVDGKVRNSTTMELLMRSVARNSAGSPTVRTLAEDISEGGTPPSESTLRDYLDILRKMFIIEYQKAWRPSLRSKTRLRTSPKIHFADPSLAAAILEAPPEVLIRDAKTAGQLFESLCYRDLCVYTSAIGGNVYHYRDESGLEIDNIIVLNKGKWGAVEVKLGAYEIDKAAANLIKLKNKVSEEMPEPSFLAVLCSNCGLAYTREDGVYVLPIDLLGP